MTPFELIHKSEVGLTFDDVTLIPQYSNIVSRKDVDISTTIMGRDFTVPIISANMDSVTGYEMAKAMARYGGLGVLHRYVDPWRVEEWLEAISNRFELPVIPSIGIQEGQFEIAKTYWNTGCLGVCVDIAHGDSKQMFSMVQKLVDAKIPVMAGNVCTYQAAYALAFWGVSAIKVGVGPGAACTTRVVTGHGIPQLTAIADIARVKKSFPNVTIIADGGIRNSGDIVKALAFGADAVMVGSLLAGTDECPCDVETGVDGKEYMVYRGMASMEARKAFDPDLDESEYTPEGASFKVLRKGPVKNILNKLTGGIRSGFSYSGARNMVEFHNYVQTMRITPSGNAEGQPHGRNIYGI